MIKFSDWMISENVQVFWAAMQRGEFITDAAAEAGTCRKKGARWLAAAGGVRPRRGRDLKGRCLSFAEREDIAVGRAAGQSLRVIAAQLGRSASTVSRELARNGDSGGGYRASSAHALAYERAYGPWSRVHQMARVYLYAPSSAISTRGLSTSAQAIARFACSPPTWWGTKAIRP